MSNIYYLISKQYLIFEYQNEFPFPQPGVKLEDGKSLRHSIVGFYGEKLRLAKTLLVKSLKYEGDSVQISSVLSRSGSTTSVRDSWVLSGTTWPSSRIPATLGTFGK